MNCRNCKNKELTNKYHDKQILDGNVNELHRDCNECGEVFIIIKNIKGNLIVKHRDR